MSQPLKVIDPHIHQWNPWTNPSKVGTLAKLIRVLPPARGPLFSLAPKSDREFVGDPVSLIRPYLPIDYAADAAGLPGGLEVEAVVHIEAGWHGTGQLGCVDETRWIAALPFGDSAAPALGGIVVHADPESPVIDAVLDAHLAASPLVRGVRCMVARHPDKGVRNWTENPDVYSDPAFLRGFEAVAARGLSFELWPYSHQLPSATALATRFPDTTFVLNHYGTPVGLAGPMGRDTGATAAARATLAARWRDDVSALAGAGNVVAKHSGMGMPLLGWNNRWPSSYRPSPARIEDVMGPLITHLQAGFGPTRTMWASNFPIDKAGISMADQITILLNVLGSSADSDLLFGENARRVYRVNG